MEILAPAGNEDMLRAAVFSGADCVYLGVKGFNARAGAANFAGLPLSQAISFCHARNCLVYAALNTLVLPGREQDFLDAAYTAAEAGCDAFIVQDLGGAALLRRALPNVPLHASTQMSVHSAAGVRTLARLGFSRVVLARELREDEIAQIAREACGLGVSLEVFVHGALCFSMSGQCYMSAMLGGRSANQGACASPCRLPFCAHLPGAEHAGRAPVAGESTCHLSPKDLSILDALPRLAALGVAAAKIEGRLRGPEYCALAVDAAKKALNGAAYDASLLQAAFSRGGFTGGWFRGDDGAAFFNAGYQDGEKSAKSALAAARELYRREAPRVPVRMRLALCETGGELLVSDGTHTVAAHYTRTLAPAEKHADEACRAALLKTGGTPFYVSGPADLALSAGGLYIPAAVVSALRREALENLLALRGRTPPDGGAGGGCALTPRPAAGAHAPPAAQTQPTAKPPVLRAAFRRAAQIPANAEEHCAEFTLPLTEAAHVPAPLRAKTWLALPRPMFPPGEARVRQAVETACADGFIGFEAQNLAHFSLCGGARMRGGFGLNIANAASVNAAARLGCEAVTLSFELSRPQMAHIAREVRAGETQPAPVLDALCYGHLPMMLTRACPAKNVTDCTACGARARLCDRTGADYELYCPAGQAGAREILNPVPLWLAEELAAFPPGAATLYFTSETRKEAAAVLDAFAQGAPAPGAFTRGLYKKGLAT